MILSAKKLGRSPPVDVVVEDPVGATVALVVVVPMNSSQSQ